jgi:leader peptidase (prepilin peptidase) / N-methyltransferase
MKYSNEGRSLGGRLLASDFLLAERGTGPRTRAGGRRLRRRNREVVDATAGVAGLLLGLLIGPLADRLATNAPAGVPLLASAPFSRRLPLVTVATALVAGGSGLDFGFTVEALIAAFFCWILVIVTRIDLEHRLIPNRIVVPAAVLVLAARTADDPSFEWLLAYLGAALVLFLIVFAYPRGMGMGDVKLAGLLGAGLGLSVIPGLFIGFLAAFVPAAVLLIRHGSDARKRAIPLGPFLALGAVIALFAGDAILDWYTSFGG